MTGAHFWTCLLLMWILDDTNGKTPATIKSVTLETTRLSGYEEVKCSTRDVYPAPRVTLFTEPDVLPDALQPSTRKVADTQGLYLVESKLRKLKDRDDLTYICLVQSFYRSQIWRSSLQEKEIYSVEGQDLIIPCEAPWNLQNFTLTWSFIKEHKSSTIFTYDSFTQLSSSVWEEKLQLSSHSDGDGSLQLRSPLRLENTGTYNCILSAFQTKHEVHTKLNIIPMTAKRLPKSSPQWWILAAVITGLVVAAVAAVIGYVKCKVSLPQSSRTHAEATEMQPSIVTIINRGAPSEESCLTEETSNRNT
ncbi:uncharacterized protein hhla2b.1 isoform X2 [Myxocyprinus asiaticus]|uniref:uncharacterized protein hhla2b.1 isoform X2 n=1 Tax=Myxocyprinus asiaticus TaxID=70543 RepID=UPI002221DEFA|nr:uncharacterized protein hhla2b.1 isoform X2 [Myxocyprinus asiaticus]